MKWFKFCHYHKKVRTNRCLFVVIKFSVERCPYKLTIFSTFNTFKGSVLCRLKSIHFCHKKILNPYESKIFMNSNFSVLTSGCFRKGKTLNDFVLYDLPRSYTIETSNESTTWSLKISEYLLKANGKYVKGACKYDAGMISKNCNR